jgi:membrane protease YdiL (CAAX protease family)
VILNKTYWTIIIVYIAMQFSGFIGFPLLQSLGIPKDQSVGWWLVISFSVGLLIILALLKGEIQTRHLNDERVSKGSAILWSIIGVFMAVFAQMFAALIEQNLFGISPESENTKTFIEIAKITPIFIVVTSIIAPILEEIVFRKIIFGSFYRKFNFWIAAIFSSLVFAAVHWDFSHLLVYTAMGMTFAYLYVKTKRILVPIIAHVAMNTLVVINFKMAEDIEKWQQELEQVQAILPF